MFPKLADSRSVDTGRRKVDIPIDTMGRERWRSRIDATEVRAEDESPTATFSGHAAMFGSRTWIGPKRWGFWEQVSKSAFTKTLAEADVRFLINHDPNLLLARNKAGTLRLSEDSKGLATEADLDTRQSYTSDVVISLDRGDISQMSFAFDVVKDSWELLDDGNELRTLLEVRLYDVSVVTYPAYEDTDAGLRGAGFDLICRSAGLDAEAQRRLLTSLQADGSLDLHDLLGDKTDESADATRSEDQPAETTGTSLEDAIRRHRHNARRFGMTA